MNTFILPGIVSQRYVHRVLNGFMVLVGGAIKPGFSFPLEIFHAKAPVGLNNAQNPVEMLFSGEAYYYKSAVCLKNTF